MPKKYIGKLALLVVLTSSVVGVHAEPKMSCPVQWDQLNDLETAKLDDLVLGMKAREWNSDVLEQVRRKSDDCARTGAGPDSIRRTAHLDGVNRIYPLAKRFVDRIALDVQQEKNRNQITASVQQSDLKNVVTLEKNGAPQTIAISYGSAGTKTKTCETIRSGVGYATVDSYKQAVQFARMCQQVNRVDADTVAFLERQAAAIPNLYKDFDGFSVRVKQLANSKSPTSKQATELQQQEDMLIEQIKSLKLTYDHSAFAEASQSLKNLSRRVQIFECAEQAMKAGFPTAWKQNYLVVDGNTPRLFCALVQGAQSSGAKMRYLSPGLFSKEGFEVKSAKRTVQVFTQANRTPGGDPEVKIMVPVSAKIEGKTFDVTQGNFRQLGAEVMAAVNNQ